MNDNLTSPSSSCTKNNVKYQLSWRKLTTPGRALIDLSRLFSFEVKTTSDTSWSFAILTLIWHNMLFLCCLTLALVRLYCQDWLKRSRLHTWLNMEKHVTYLDTSCRRGRTAWDSMTRDCWGCVWTTHRENSRPLSVSACGRFGKFHPSACQSGCVDPVATIRTWSSAP